MNAPLHGQRILNTRAVGQAERLNALLREHGAIPIDYPCIAIAPPVDVTSLDRSVERLVAGAYDWLVLTSGNAVQAIADRLDRLNKPIGNVKFAAVGPATAQESAARLGARPSFVPETHTGAALAAGLPVRPGVRVMLPVSEIAPPDVAEELRQRGALVDVVTAYRNVTGSGGSDLPLLLAEGQIDALTFCSSSAVTGFITRIAEEGGALRHALELPAVCMGPNSLSTAIARGFHTAAAARTQSLDGLIAGLIETVTAQHRGGLHWT